MDRTKLQSRVAAARNHRSFAAYLEVREYVLDLFEDDVDVVTSRYWAEEVEQFDYLFEASPLVVRKIREHCFSITGIRPYEYREHHAHKAKAFQRKLDALQRLDPLGLFVPENSELGGFGHRIDGQLVNIDTLKFYESLIALALAGELQRVGQMERPRVVEIGAGWGGFAYQFLNVVPDAQYIIIDLPHTFLFSATYLKTLFPHAHVQLLRPTQGDALDPDAAIIFIPSHRVRDVDLSEADLAINMVSFQEMTTAQVQEYIELLADSSCPVIYSHNRDRSAHNVELTAVTDILKSSYAVEEIRVLPVPYTVLDLPKSGRHDSPVAVSVPSRARSFVTRRSREARISAPVLRPAVDYRHLIGRLNG